MLQLEKYLTAVREITDSLPSTPDQLKALEALINGQNWKEENPDYELFFRGELYFYAGKYDNALKLYLEAKTIPHQHFFCFRASSLLLQSRGKTELALTFAQKALNILPDDPSVKAILFSAQKNERASESVLSIELAVSGGIKGNISDQLSIHNTQSMEHSMNSGSDIFSSATQSDPAARESLTERLYSFDNHPLPKNLPSDQLKALQELRKLAGADVKNTTIHPIAHHNSANTALEERIQWFQNKHTEQIQKYLEQTEGRTKLPDNSLYVLNGWNFDNPPFKPVQITNPALLTEESRKSHGGHYLRWAGKGIAINPGPGFIKNFHDQGLCIRDIDFVIVTHNSPDAYGDIKGISDLNSQLNQTSGKLQIIHYYLHHKARQELGAFLKPSFKQARHTIHSLEMFLDSPDVEKVEIADGITLNYFPSVDIEAYNYAKTSDNRSSTIASTLGITLNLSDESKTIRVGYTSGMGWSPLIAHHLANCDLLLASFGNTNPRDYSKLGYNENSLGYYGCASLLEEVSPSLMLLTEFGGKEGDIRLEVIKQLRQEFCASHLNPTGHSSIILPADIGLTVDLHSLHIRCSMSQEYIPASSLCVVASTADFGRLNYLSPRFCI